VRFFCARREDVIALKNRIFALKSDTEKRRHLAAVLKSSAGGALDDEMIRRILPKVSIDRQYTVSVFCDSAAFRTAVSRTLADKTGLYVIAPQGKRRSEPIAAVITLSEKDGNDVRAIYVCTPAHPGKGQNDGQGL
jgi:hypothetical protein